MAKAKSPKKQTLPLKERAVRAALDLAAEKGWEETSLQDIARRCKCKLSELREIFEDRADILASYGRGVDRVVMDRVSVDAASPERDRLFDVMMERFDVLNDDRTALLSIVYALKKEPKQAAALLPHIGRSMVWMLEAAGIDARGPRGTATALGLTGVYLYTLKAWVDDESPDMGKTMAALDKALGRAEKVAGFFDRGQ